jgi:protein-S-isoprenylcysteine O-methyltransferase Ste14
MSAARQAFAIAVLPGTAAIVVPAAILAVEGVETGFGDGALAVAAIAAGAILVVAGAAMWAWTVRLFARVGRGTLAPWDPTRNLVVEGPYRHVRNPMISAVVAVLAGEGLIFGSTGVLIWAAIFLAVNWIWFVVREEPELSERFGEEYREYKGAVPRWLPRATPWSPQPNSSSVAGSPRSTSGGSS